MQTRSTVQKRYKSILNSISIFSFLELAIIIVYLYVNWENIQNIASGQGVSGKTEDIIRVLVILLAAYAAMLLFSYFYKHKIMMAVLRCEYAGFIGFMTYMTVIDKSPHLGISIFTVIFLATIAFFHFYRSLNA